MLIVHPGVAAKTLAEFVALAKAKPRALNYASAGEVSLANLGMLILAGKTDMQLTHVPYRSTAQSIVDVVSGIIHAQIASVPPTLELERSGKVRALAVTTGKRIADHAERPDGDGIRRRRLRAVVLDGDLCARRHAGSRSSRGSTARSTRSCRPPEVRKALAEQGVDAEPTTPDALGALVRKETAKFRAVVEQAGIKPQ